MKRQQQPLGLEMSSSHVLYRLRCRACGHVRVTPDAQTTVDPRWVIGACPSCRVSRTVLDVIEKTEGANHVQPT